MKVSVLNAVTKLAGKISNQSSLTSLYRSIELGKESIRCCSEFGNIAIATDDTGLTEAVLLDTEQVSGTVKTLPQDSEITLTQSDGKITYQCGSASGRWNIVHSDYGIPVITHDNFPWKPAPELPTAMGLATSACVATAVAVGLYGIVLEAEGDKLKLMSTNTISLAAVTLDKGSFPVQKITLRPPVPGIIASFLATCPNCEMDVIQEGPNSGIYIKGDWLLAHLPLGTALDFNLLELSGRYVSNTQSTTIDNAAVKRFLDRARNMADRHAFFTVVVKVQDGRLMLTHTAIAAQTEEWFLASGLPAGLSYDAVPMPAEMLAISLPHIKTVTFDYLQDKVIVLRGTDPEFMYVIGEG